MIRLILNWRALKLAPPLQNPLWLQNREEGKRRERADEAQEQESMGHLALTAQTPEFYILLRIL